MAQLNSNSQLKDYPYVVGLDNGQVNCANGVKFLSRLLRHALADGGPIVHYFFSFNKGNQKYRGMFETQKSGNKTSSGEIDLNLQHLQVPKDANSSGHLVQVSGGVSVLCWHAASVANVLWKLPAFR